MTAATQTGMLHGGTGYAHPTERKATGMTTLSRPSADSASLQAERLKKCGAAAERLLAFYPQGKPTEPEVYLAGLVHKLRQFSLAAVAAACSPDGLPSKTKFLPTIADVEEFCRKFDVTALHASHQQHIEQQRLEDRSQREEELGRAPGRTFRDCLEELRAVGLWGVGRPPSEPKTFPPGTTIGIMDFDSATHAKAHGRPYGWNELGRQLPYRG